MPIVANACTPDAVQDFLDRATPVSMRTVADFIDAYGRRVAIPLGSEGRSPVLPEGYARCWWELKCRDLLLGDDDETVFRRNFDGKTRKLTTSYHRVNDIETEFGVPSQKTISGMQALLVQVLRERHDRPRVHKGIRFDGAAFIREKSEHGKTYVHRIDASDERLREPFELQFDCKFDDELVDEARGWLAWMTNDEHSADNLCRFFANPILEAKKDRTFLGYGQGANGKGTMWEALEQDPATAAFCTTFSSETLFPTGSPSTAQEQAPLGLVGKLWACDPDSSPISSAQETMLKKLTTGDPVIARQLKQSNSVVRNKATLVIFTNNEVCLSNTTALDRRIVNIRFKDGHKAVEFLPLRAFLEEHGIAPFIMSSCVLWESGDEPWTDVVINDEDSMTDYELAIADAIVDHGYAAIPDLPSVSRKEAKDSRLRLGVVQKQQWVYPTNGERVQIRVLKVEREDRFAPFRARCEADAEQAAEVAHASESRAAQVVRDAFHGVQAMGLADALSSGELVNYMKMVGLLTDEAEGEKAVATLAEAGVIARTDGKYKLVG
ncbi:DUF5906 domain-containing protein [Bifidobacterium dentium]|uniref:DUF5906 domain-containing protein n=1 Tax=Bifidobacterium dentium TaxID=1689 RepID=UPI0030C73B0C